MDRVMVSVAGGAMASLLRKVASLTAEQCSRLMGVPADIEWLKRELRCMRAFLMELSDIEEPDQVVKCWKDELRELSYDMEDAIDRFELCSGHEPDRASSSSSTGSFMGSLQRCMDLVKCLESRYSMSREIQHLRDHVSEAEHQRKRYKIGEPARYCAVDTHVVALYKEAVNLVGVDGPRETIISWLMNGDCSSSSPRDRKVVSIVGYGGIGKTTLAKQIFDKIKEQFNCAAFVSVSRKPSKKDIIKHIILQVQPSCAMAELGQLDLQGNPQPFVDLHRTYLRHKRYFIVVDDIWDTKTWEFIACGLFDNGCGSRIITTTRVLSVAKFCSSGRGYIHRMEPLCDEDSRRLFLKRVFESEACPPPMETIFVKILKKCGGSPLAILTVSSMLVDKREPDQWEQVCDSIGLGISEDDDVSAMRRILSYSYFDLPHHQRTCLLYLSIFPEDYVIERKRLVYRWIAEGFINAHNGEKEIEVGDSYFNELINRSLIQPVEIKYNGKVNQCRVHDTILDFIVSKSAEENFVTVLGVQERLQKKIRHLSFHTTFGKECTILEEKDLYHVRSLTMFRANIEKIPSGLKNLRVLDLASCHTGLGNRYHNHRDRFFGNITELSYLRYLAVPYSFRKIERLPEEYGNLQHLQTLDLRQLINLKELPSTFSKLRSLVRLFISSHATKLPDSGIGDMTVLEELEGINITIQSLKFLHELGRLTRLRKLGIGFNSSDSKGVKEPVFLSSLYKLGRCSLRSLTIRAYDDEGELTTVSLAPPSIDNLWQAAVPGLRKISVYVIYRVPKWMGSLENLQKMRLLVRGMWQHGLDILGSLQNLLYLCLGFTYDLEEMLVFSGNNGFQCLKYLEIKLPLGKGEERMKNVMFEARSMPRIENLKLELNCASSCTGQVLTSEWEVHARMCSTLSRSEIANLYDFGIENLTSLTTLNVCNECCLPVAVEVSEAAIKDAISKLPNFTTLKFESSLKVPYKKDLHLDKEKERKEDDVADNDDDNDDKEEEAEKEEKEEEEEEDMDAEGLAKVKNHHTSSTIPKRQRQEEELKRRRQSDEARLAEEYAESVVEWRTSMHNYNISMQRFMENVAAHIGMTTTAILPPSPPPPPPPTYWVTKASIIKDEPTSSSKPTSKASTPLISEINMSPFTEEEIRSVLMEAPVTTKDLVCRFKSRLRGPEDKSAFVEILKKISKTQRTNGRNYLVLREDKK